jgi:hypothetical protein
MKTSELLRQAAEQVLKDSDYGCLAIRSRLWVYLDQSGFILTSEYANRFEDALSYFILFKGDQDDPDYGWFGRCDDPEAREHRTLSLLFAAEIAESEGN